MKYYFLGIGGIGMSALARYFKHEGYEVSGYDRTVSPLTKELEAEGIDIVYDDDLGPSQGDCKTADAVGCFDPMETVVVRTPAVPEDQPIYCYFREHGFRILKRSEVLGEVTRQKKALCVAGTHGKTTTSTMLAHLMNPVNAFLGGISNNYGTNLLLSKDSPYVVVEADEYDRSFHHLSPYMSVITSIDPDHLDIYGSAEAYQEGFDIYAGKVTRAIVIKKRYEVRVNSEEVRVYTYGVNDGDFHASNIRVGEGTIVFDFVTPDGVVSDIELGVPVWVNIENSVAAMSIAHLNGIEADVLRERIKSYRGVYRRFDIHIRRDDLVYIDDYAHHPTELKASMESVRKLYPNRHFIAVFQPHLYTRTRDFLTEFSKVLSTADEVILLPIYPAREKPIAGVTSEALGYPVVQKSELIDVLRERIKAVNGPVVLMTLGAGDIDRLVGDISDKL